MRSNKNATNSLKLNVASKERKFAFVEILSAFEWSLSNSMNVSNGSEEY